MLSTAPIFAPREAVADPELGRRDTVASLPGSVARLSRHRRGTVVYASNPVASVSRNSRVAVAS